MSITALRQVLKVFTGEQLDPDDRAQFVKEVLLMTLARAARADTKVVAVEVSTVREAIRRATGEDLSDAEIRVAASAALFETVSLEDALARLRGQLTGEDRILIVKRLEEVIRSDARVSEFELDYFDAVAGALGIRPRELAGLV